MQVIRWIWILALGLSFGLLGCGEDAPPPEEAPVEEPEEVVVEVEPIVDFAEIYEAPDRDALVGREVELTEMRVESVVGDSTFWAVLNDGSSTERAFVVLQNLGESETGDGTGEDGRYNVDEGDVLAVYGTVAGLRAEDPQVWAIRDEDSPGLMEGKIYIRANRLAKNE